MKGWSKFILGILVGLAIAFIIDLVERNLSNHKEMIFFETPGNIMPIMALKVSQVIDDNYALAYGQKLNFLPSQFFKNDILVLITNDNEEYYYDGQIIDVITGKYLRQIGIYKYTDKSGSIKTIPIVKLMDYE